MILRFSLPNLIDDDKGFQYVFQLCGREKWCEHDHRIRRCSLNFLGVDGEAENVRNYSNIYIYIYI